MVTTTDGRKFFTLEKNFRSLVEFANVFNAEIALVDVTADKPPVLDLLKLANAISDQSYNAGDVPHTVVRVKIQKRDRSAPEEQEAQQNLQTKAEEISKFVMGLFESGAQVSIEIIARHFKKYGFSEACYRNHMAKARKQLMESGRVVVKVKPGIYTLAPLEKK